MTRQELFDQTVRHLFTQGGPSFTTTGCLYRAPNGRKCAVGFWIPDDRYIPDIESKGVCMDGKRITAELEPVLPPELHEHAPLLAELQKGHDRADYSERKTPAPWFNVWHDNGIAHIMEWIAGRFNLSPAVVYECWPQTQKEQVA
jgi:hypothetical protein